MQKTLTKHGNSYALVIDKPIMDLLHVTPETPFEIMSDGQCLVLTPVRDPTRESPKFAVALQKSCVWNERLMCAKCVENVWMT
jgi:antitoxin component of MazEF toxin-antitoxin module